MPKKKPKTGKPQVHKELEGFELTINEFGEIKSNTDVGKLNKFLNENVEDKKLKDRDDIEGLIDSSDDDEEQLFDDDNDGEEE